MGKADWLLKKDAARTTLYLSVRRIGEGFIVCLYNENEHLGAVAVSEFDDRTNRVSTSVITLLGHKDDTVAQRAAYLVSRNTKRPVCAVAGIHLDNITQGEIAEILNSAEELVQEFLSQKLQKSNAFLG